MLSLGKTFLVKMSLDDDGGDVESDYDPFGYLLAPGQKQAIVERSRIIPNA